MKRKSIQNKNFKIIPEAKLVQGEMPEKLIAYDLTAGIKSKYKDLILAASFEYEDDWFPYDNVITANAYCDEKDEWDEKVGTDVCAAKLELKNHQKLAKKYDRIARDLQEACLIAQSYCIRHEAKAMSIEDDLIQYHGRLPM